jgi:hypothetical protein
MVCSAGGVGLQLLAEKLIDAKRRAVVRPHNGRIARNGQLAPPTPRPTENPPCVVAALCLPAQRHSIPELEQAWVTDGYLRLDFDDYISRSRGTVRGAAPGRPRTGAGGDHGIAKM